MAKSLRIPSLACLVLVACAAPAMAATFTVEPTGPDSGYVRMRGDVTDGDAERFAQAVRPLRAAIVDLSSPGGQVVPALEIGREIRKRGYATSVANGSTCASACAAIWSGGTERFMAPTARLGFHAAYSDKNGVKTQVGVANAVLGGYLRDMGFGQDAIVFATVAGPTEAMWLTPRIADQISVYMRIEAEMGMPTSYGHALPAGAQPSVAALPTGPTREQVALYKANLTRCVTRDKRCDRAVLTRPDQDYLTYELRAQRFDPATAAEVVDVRMENYGESQASASARAR